MSVMDADGEPQRYDVIVDTGFTGWLTLPESDIRRLGLARAGSRDSITARGNAGEFDYYETWVLWHGQLHEVEIFQSIDQPLDQPLLGMELLEGSRVAVNAWDDGDVIIEEVQPV